MYSFKKHEPKKRIYIQQKKKKVLHLSGPLGWIKSFHTIHNIYGDFSTPILLQQLLFFIIIVALTHIYLQG